MAYRLFCRCRAIKPKLDLSEAMVFAGFLKSCHVDSKPAQGEWTLDFCWPFGMVRVKSTGFFSAGNILNIKCSFFLKNSDVHFIVTILSPSRIVYQRKWKGVQCSLFGFYHDAFNSNLFVDLFVSFGSVWAETEERIILLFLTLKNCLLIYSLTRFYRKFFSQYV